jgi:hypothetical protein
MRRPPPPRTPGQRRSRRPSPGPPRAPGTAAAAGSRAPHRANRRSHQRQHSFPIHQPPPAPTTTTAAGGGDRGGGRRARRGRDAGRRRHPQPAADHPSRPPLGWRSGDQLGHYARATAIGRHRVDPAPRHASARRAPPTALTATARPPARNRAQCRRASDRSEECGDPSGGGLGVDDHRHAHPDGRHHRPDEPVKRCHHDPAPTATSRSPVAGSGASTSTGGGGGGGGSGGGSGGTAVKQGAPPCGLGQLGCQGTILQNNIITASKEAGHAHDETEW